MICGMAVRKKNKLPKLSPPLYIFHIYLISLSIFFVCAFLKGSILSLCLSLLLFYFPTFILIVLSKKEKKKAKSTHTIFSTPHQTPVICTQKNSQLFSICFANFIIPYSSIVCL